MRLLLRFGVAALILVSASAVAGPLEKPKAPDARVSVSTLFEGFVSTVNEGVPVPVPAHS